MQSLDADGKTARLLQRQFKGYKNNDPSTRQQKPIPVELLRMMIDQETRDPGRQAFHELNHLAFFFAMRSCEYLKIKQGERRTKALCLRNLTFRRDHHILLHDDPDLASADTVTVTFEFQKRNDRDDPVTQSRSNDPLLCPVRAAAAIVNRLRAIGATKDTPLYTYRDSNGRFRDMTNKIALRLLRAFIKAEGRPFGLYENDIGLHSIRASAAMAMHMNKVPDYVIRKMGRWSSEAFLLYIRKCVIEFGNDVSAQMIKTRVFHHIEPFDPGDPRSHHNNPMSAAENSFMGDNDAPIDRWVFSLWG